MYRSDPSIHLEFSVHKQPDNGQITMLDVKNGIAVLDTKEKAGIFTFEIIAKDSKGDKSLATLVVTKELVSDTSTNSLRQFTLQGIGAGRLYVSNP